MEKSCGIKLKRDVTFWEILIVVLLFVLSTVLNSGTNLYTVLELSDDINFDVKEQADAFAAEEEAKKQTPPPV